MNIAQFLDKLAQTRHRPWCITKEGRIRLGEACPITAVTNPVLPLPAYRVAFEADRIGIQPSVLGLIMSAADNTEAYSRTTRALRKEMLRVLGLKKEATNDPR